MSQGFRTIVLLLALMGAAFGEDGRPLPFDTVLIGTRGNKLEDKDGPMTLSRVAIDSLLVTPDEERLLPGTEKFKRVELARKIYNTPGAPLKVEEIALIKERIGKVWSPEVMYPAWLLIEGTAGVR